MLFVRVQIFDRFVPCLRDSNSKVNLFALQVMVELTPVLREHFNGVSPYTISTVTANLGSKNREIYETAASVLDAFMEHLGLLSQRWLLGVGRKMWLSYALALSRCRLWDYSSAVLSAGVKRQRADHARHDRPRVV